MGHGDIGYWRGVARQVIHEVHTDLPDDASLDERKKAVDAAYPFGPRKYHPYKMWLKERAEYLGKYGYRGGGQKRHESPLERLMRRAQEGK